MWNANAPLLTGLLLREFFDSLSGEARLAADVWTIVVVFLLVSVAVQVVMNGSHIVLTRFGANLYRAILQGNLFGKILESPPFAEAPSVGDTVNRFRDDVEGLSRTTLRALSVAPFLSLGRGGPGSHDSDKPAADGGRVSSSGPGHAGDQAGWSASPGL